LRGGEEEWNFAGFVGTSSGDRHGIEGGKRYEVIRHLERSPFTADDVPVGDFAGELGAVIPASQRAAGEDVQVMVQDAARWFARILRAHVIVFVDVDFPAVEEGIGRSVRAEPEGGPPTGLLAEFHPRLEVAVSEDLVGIEAGALGFGLVGRRPVADDFQQPVVDFDVAPFTRGAEVPFAGIDPLVCSPRNTRTRKKGPF